MSKALTDRRIFGIRDSIKAGDGWDGDQWDLALSHAIESELAESATEKAAANTAKIDLIIRDVCESDPADWKEPSTLCISADDLRLILEQRINAETEPA